MQRKYIARIPKSLCLQQNVSSVISLYFIFLWGNSGCIPSENQAARVWHYLIQTTVFVIVGPVFTCDVLKNLTDAARGQVDKTLNGGSKVCRFKSQFRPHSFLIPTSCTCPQNCGLSVYVHWMLAGLNPVQLIIIFSSFTWFQESGLSVKYAGWN